MTSITRAIVTIALAVGLAVAGLAAATPAQAQVVEDAVSSSKAPTKVAARRGYFNDVYHAADDSGYTAAIHVVCENGTHLYLGRGETSRNGCGAHVRKVVARLDQHVRMFNDIPPYQTINVFPGWSVDVPSGGSFRMYMQRPY